MKIKVTVEVSLKEMEAAIAAYVEQRNPGYVSKKVWIQIVPDGEYSFRIEYADVDLEKR